MQEFLNKLNINARDAQNPDKLKKAKLKRCKETHPDHGGDQKEFMEVMHAYEMLTNPEYRDKEQKKKPDPGNLDIRLQVPITFLDGFFGKQVTISYNRNVVNNLGVPLELTEFEVITISIDVPVGTCAPTERRYSGKGLQRQDSETFGDASVVIVPNKHPKFQVRDNDVLAMEQIPIDIMLKGGEIDVQTLFGIKTAIIPPGSLPQSMVPIKDCGVPNTGGSHIVILEPVFPTKEELRSKKVWQKLEIDWKDKEPPPEDKYQQDFYKWIQQQETMG